MPDHVQAGALIASGGYRWTLADPNASPRLAAVSWVTRANRAWPRGVAAGRVKPAKAASTDGARGSAGVSQKTASAPANALSTTAASPCEPSTMSRSSRTPAGSCDGSRGDDPELFATLEQVAEHLAADLAGGGGDDDHGNLPGMIVMRIAITLSLNASSLCLDMVYPGTAR